MDTDTKAQAMTGLDYSIDLMTTGRKDPEFQARACEKIRGGGWARWIVPLG